MTLNTLRFRAPSRAHAEPARVSQDRSLAYVLWLLMFLVFAPMVGVHVAFVLFPEPAEASAVERRNAAGGKHG